MNGMEGEEFIACLDFFCELRAKTTEVQRGAAFLSFSGYCCVPEKGGVGKGKINVSMENMSLK